MFQQQNSTRKLICSILGGLIYGIGFWILIDAIALARKHPLDYIGIKFHWCLPFLLSTLSIVFMNCWTGEDFRGAGISEVNTTRSRICFLLSIVGLITGFAISLVIAVEHYFDVPKANGYPGAALILCNLTCLVSALVVRAGHW